MAFACKFKVEFQERGAAHIHSINPADATHETSIFYD